MGASGQAQVDFGAFPGKSDTSLAIIGQAGIAAGSLVEAWLFPAATADHSSDEHVVENIKITAGNIVAGTGFTIYAVNMSETNEPLEIPGVDTFGALGGSAKGGPAPSVGGMGTRLYGQWNVGWVWV